jgi:[ribosomal protein S18]-alanine N-acetyltransferase
MQIMSVDPMPKSIGRIPQRDVNIRAIEAGHVEAILSIQSGCREIAQWTAADYNRVAQGEMAGWIAETGTGSDIVGFLVARQVASDVEVLNFAVWASLRRKGIGAALLRTALNWGDSLHSENVLLEVRESNSIALRFYNRHGFQVTGRRQRYYAEPVEDALLLTAPLHHAHSPISS